MFNGCPDWDSNALPTELHRQSGKLPKSLSLIAKHWAREYREKTTPSRIFMPCNLSSCRVSYGTQHYLKNSLAWYLESIIIPGMADIAIQTHGCCTIYKIKMSLLDQNCRAGSKSQCIRILYLQFKYLYLTCPSCIGPSSWLVLNLFFKYNQQQVEFCN